jgi:hypothetical protein
MSRATVCTSPEGARKRTVTSSKATAGVLMPLARSDGAGRSGSTP